MLSGNNARRQGGYTYLLLIFAIAAAGMALATFGESTFRDAEREKSVQLDFIGRQFIAAMRSYRTNTPAGQPSFPQHLADLVDDRRGPVPRHHLRQVYTDPYTRQADWSLVKRGNDIIGIYSPLREDRKFVADLEGE
jgi:type II secretory pathway pseudopilin PulG